MKRTKKPRHTLKVGDLEFTGNTRAELTAAIISVADKMLKWEMFRPLVFASPVAGELIVVSCNPEGSWSYEFLRPYTVEETASGEITPGTLKKGGSCHGWSTKSECVEHARRHMAQLAYRPGEGTDGPSFSWLAPWDQCGADEHQRWVWFQEKHHAESLGAATAQPDTAQPEEKLRP